MRKAENKASFMMFTRESVIALKQLHLVDIVDVNQHTKKKSEIFYWHGMVDDVKNYIKTCQKCQHQGKIFKKISPDLQSIPTESEVMKQVGVDLCNLPEVDGFKHLIVLIDYFSK